MATALTFIFICCLICGGFGLAVLLLAIFWYPLAKRAGMADSLREWLSMF